VITGAQTEIANYRTGRPINALHKLGISALDLSMPKSYLSRISLSRCAYTVSERQMLERTR
jgi:hypothetical protein